MRKTAVCLLMLSLSSLSTSALAASMMKPGLWEVNMKSDAMKNMPKISPEQIEMMRKKGINVPDMKDGGMAVKSCISKAMAERDSAPEMNQAQTGCQAKNYQRTGNGYSLDLVCDGPNMKGAGTVKGTFANAENFSSTYTFKGTSHGHPVDMKQESTGKWLSADCGSVKPVDEMVQKK
jgi:hypothetical protein